MSLLLDANVHSLEIFSRYLLTNLLQASRTFYEYSFIPYPSLHDSINSTQ